MVVKLRQWVLPVTLLVVLGFLLLNLMSLPALSDSADCGSGSCKCSCSGTTCHCDASHGACECECVIGKGDKCPDDVPQT
jgi:hypothetical protein